MVKTCEICGKYFECDKHSERKTCSTKCRYELRKRTKEQKVELSQSHEVKALSSDDVIENLQSDIKQTDTSIDTTEHIDLDNTITCTGIQVKNAYERIIYDYLVKTGQNFIYNFPLEFEYNGNRQLTYISFNIDNRYIDVRLPGLLSPIHHNTYLPIEMILECYKQNDVSVITDDEFLSLLQMNQIKAILNTRFSVDTFVATMSKIFIYK